MCTTCGCAAGAVTIDGDHHHHHHHDPSDTAPGRVIALEIDLLVKNDAIAARNRARLEEANCLALNVMSSPGAGKTSLLVALVRHLSDRVPLAVIEGDQATANDAERIRATGVVAVQVNTGKGCHLDAHMIEHALERLGIPPHGMVFVENVGNLVCPAAFDLGEARKIVVASVTEGEDKPLKYPDMFAVADLLLINKVDLLPHLDFDIEALRANARTVNPRIACIEVSAKSGAGLAAVADWLEAARPGADAA
ncbi:MAG: hydrogenase nickel incorporation protein HypB [Pseudomonadota bacterium]